MISEELICGLSGENHFTKNPIKLSKCNHSICRNCFNKHNREHIKCLVCGIETKKGDLKYDDDVCDEFKNIFNSS
jgi:hypothetical protein